MTRTTTTRRGRAWRPVAVAAAVLAALGLTVVAPAAASVPGSASATTAADEAMSPVMIVLDASGSMNQTDAPGPRIDAAKAAVRNMVGGLPANAQVGLTVYGTHTGSSDAEKAAGCQDITQLAPVGTVDKSALTAAVNGIVAKGYTPIGTALQKAAAALPAEGRRAIVLVSDGEDTCSPPPPCDVAAQLKAQGVDLVVHTVGFKVDDVARQQLSCIAQATGGTYSDAEDAGSLDTSLSTQVNRALEPYDVQGTKVKGTSGPAGAPTLAPGQYQDTLLNAGDDNGRDGPGNYYAVDLQKGETPYLTATIVPRAEDTHQTVNQLFVTAVLTADQPGTGDCSIVRDGFSGTMDNKFVPATVVVAPGEVGGRGWPSGCPTSGTFFLKVNRNRGGDAPMPLEVAYRSEPTADVTGVPAQATSVGTPPLPTPSADVTATAGGASFNSATELTPGTTVSDTIVFGESRYFKVHVDWGQRFAFRFDTGVVDGLSQFDGVQSRVTAFNPVRDGLPDIATSTNNSFPYLGVRAGELSGGSTVPARWTNREAYTGVQYYLLDGDYYLSYSAGYTGSGATATVPYTLTVDVTGDKEQGPRYSQRVGPSSSSSTGGSNGAASNGSASTGAGSNGAAGNGSAQLSESEHTGWSTGRTTLVGGSIGLAVLAAIVLCWLVYGRRRTPRPATPPVTPPPGGADSS